VFAIFDIETRVDKRLLNEALCAGEGLTDEDAFQQFRENLRARRGSDFFPLTLHIPISIAIGDVGGHGLAAAAGMARLRGALAGLAITGSPPERRW